MDVDNRFVPADETFAEGVRRERRDALTRLRADAVAGGDLRYARKALGMRAAELAAALDVTPETVSRWETDARPIPQTTRLAVVALLMLRDAALTEHREGQARSDAGGTISSPRA